MECMEFNWLYKHMKKVGSSHSCTELSKAQFFPVSIVNFTPDNCVLCQFSSDITRILPDNVRYPMLIFRTVRQQYFTTSNLVSVVFFSFYSRLSSSHEIIFQKVLEMVLHMIVQYYTLIFILNNGRRVGFCFGNQQGLFQIFWVRSALSFEKNVLIKNG